MNFLQLAQRTRQECSISGSGPVTTSSQTGEMEKIADWVLTAYQDIQERHPNWNFLRFDFSFPTIASSSTYLPSAVSLSELGSWKEQGIKVYLTSTADQSRIYSRNWESFRESRLFGTISEGRPSEFSIKPDGAIVFWPTPNAIFTVTGEYWKRAQTMTANTDEPLVPSQFQMAIVWKAAQYYAADQGAAESYAATEREYMRVMRKLELNQLPPIRTAGPIA